MPGRRSWTPHQSSKRSALRRFARSPPPFSRRRPRAPPPDGLAAANPAPDRRFRNLRTARFARRTRRKLPKSRDSSHRHNFACAITPGSTDLLHEIANLKARTSGTPFAFWRGSIQRTALWRFGVPSASTRDAREGGSMQQVNKVRMLIVISLAVVASASCSRSPEAQKTRHLERGEKFFARKDYKDAIIEYRNVLRIEPANAMAIRRLGLAHYQTGQFRDAFPYLSKATELEPQDEDIRLKLGTILLVARRPDDAHAQASAILDRDGKNFEAVLLLVDSARQPAEVDAALKRLEDERITFQDRPKYHIALG